MHGDGHLLKLIQDRFPEYSNRQKELARYILANHRQVAFASISRLAELSGVSEATIVRFAKTIGFNGYPSLQKEIRRIVRTDLDGGERFRSTVEAPFDGNGLLARIIRQEMENFADLQEKLDRRSLSEVIQAIARASETVIIGVRSTASLACHFTFALDKLSYKARRITAVCTDTYAELARLDPAALIIVIGYPRYLAELAAVLDFAKSRKLKTVAITDSPFSPLAGDLNLFTPAISISFIAFHCAPLVLINLIVTELGRSNEKRTLQTLGDFEALAEERRFFDRSSIKPRGLPTDQDE